MATSSDVRMGDVYTTTASPFPPLIGIVISISPFGKVPLSAVNVTRVPSGSGFPWLSTTRAVKIEKSDPFPIMVRGLGVSTISVVLMSDRTKTPSVDEIGMPRFIPANAVLSSVTPLACGATISTRRFSVSDSPGWRSPTLQIAIFGWGKAAPGASRISQSATSSVSDMVTCWATSLPALLTVIAKSMGTPVPRVSSTVALVSWRIGAVVNIGMLIAITAMSGTLISVVVSVNVLGRASSRPSADRALSVMVDELVIGPGSSGSTSI